MTIVLAFSSWYDLLLNIDVESIKAKILAAQNVKNQFTDIQMNRM